MFENIEKDVEKVLTDFTREAAENKYRGNLLWTSGIKKKLADLGELEYHCKICTSGFDDCYEQAWLYDLVWYQEDTEKRMIRVPLVVESEWNNGIKGIKSDFEKLLLTNADLRLMICQAHPDNKETTLNYFREAISLYQQGQSGEKFMIALLDTDTEEFSFLLFHRN